MFELVFHAELENWLILYVYWLALGFKFPKYHYTTHHSMRDFTLIDVQATSKLSNIRTNTHLSDQNPPLNILSAYIFQNTSSENEPGHRLLQNMFLN